jgi:zinc transporter ZupT
MRRSSAALAVLPLLLVALLIAGFVFWRPFDFLSAGVPPAEELAVERVILDETGIRAYVRAQGSVPLTIAQVQVDSGYRVFTMTPPGPLARFASARIDISFPWVAGEAHTLAFVTNTGAAFGHTIEVASATPKASPSSVAILALVGLMVGVVPVAIGLAFHPAMRRAGQGVWRFLLGLTVGLLAFLLFDTIREGLEVAEAAIGGLSAASLFWSAAALSLLVLLAIGRRQGRSPEGLALAYFIAIGIGLHNLGEGLAIGTSLATGEVALASYLVLGFGIHNITEGLGIAAPIAAAPLSFATFAALAAIAGLPAVAGTLLGTFAYAPHLAALAFGVAAGAILQVIIEVSLYLARRSGAWTGVLDSSAVTGIGAGLLIMYATTLLIQA